MVDLGLSVKWAKYNLGATGGDTVESWYGNYYAWGETSTKSNYSWQTYKFSGEPFSKYDTDGKTELEAEDDAANVNQPPLRMPSVVEFYELLNNTNNQWVTDYEGISGLNGYTFTANGNTLFIPAAGNYDGSMCDPGNGGGLWSYNLNFDNHNYAGNLYFDSSFISPIDDC